MDSNIGNIIKNDKARAIIYGVYVLSGLVIGALQAFIVDPDPQWLTQTFAAWSYLGLAVGTLAVTNSSIVPVRNVIVEAPSDVAIQSDSVSVDDSDQSGHV